MIRRIPSIVTVLTFSLITALFWIGFSVYKIITNPKTTTDVPEEILVPLDPSLDQAVLQDVSSRLYLDENLIQGYIDNYETIVEVEQQNQEEAQSAETTESSEEDPVPTEEGPIATSEPIEQINENGQ